MIGHEKVVHEKLVLLEQRCRESRVPMTVHRRTVMECLSGRTDHPSADQVYDAVKARLPGVSRVTVYRVLDALVSWGLARRICNAEARARFDADMSRHHHVQCLGCGRIADVHEAALDDLPVPRNSEGFTLLDYTVSFSGMCAECGTSALQWKGKGVS